MMLPVESTDRMLNAGYKNAVLNVYDFCAEEWGKESEIFLKCKPMADNLVADKLAKFTNESKTQLSITNFERYRMTHGGYLIYLKEGDKKIKSEKDKHNEQLKEELKEARLKFTHYRIVTYWWGFIISIISFILSLLSLYLILSKK